MADSKTIISEAEEKMDMAIMYLEDALAHIRAGKADVRLLDGIRVDSYGSMVPINNVAAVTTPDARSIAIKPWDKSMFRIIEKAIIDSDDEVLARGLKVMDLTATCMCKENNLPIIVFDMDTVGNLKKVMSGENIGTLVHN